MSLPALADEPAPSEEKKGPLERVVVTATKRSESVRDVPMAVTAITGTELDKQHATSFSDYVNLVPGMMYQASDPGHTVLVLRGINAEGVAATLATYLDETPYGSSTALANGTNKALNLDTFDMERVEILRGPQGTLYGANTLGGLLKFVANKPNTSEVDHKFQFGGSGVEDGDFGGFAKGMVNIPFSDTVAMRAVGYYENSPGFIDDTNRHLSNINEVESVGGRAALLFAPSDNFSLTVNAVTQTIDAGSGPGVDVDVVGNRIVPHEGDLEQKRVFGEASNVKYNIYNATANWDMGWAQFVSATSWGVHDETNIQDGSGVFGTYIDSDVNIDRLTQELRLASPDDGRALEWLFGAYFTHERSKIHQDVVGTGLFLQLNAKFIEQAAFANLTYHFSEAFDIGLGGRYSTNDQAVNQYGFAATDGESSENVFTYSVAPRWHVSDDTLLYARVAKGYRPGGPNVILPHDPSIVVPETFKSDTAINYEVGVKSDLLDGRMLIDADVFYIDWSDIQILRTITGVGGVNDNAGSAVSKGAEFAVAWALTDQLTVRAGGAYVEAYLTSDTDPGDTNPASKKGRAGDPLPFSPKWSGSLTADYRFEAVGAIEPFLGVTWRYVGDRKTGFDAGIGQIPVDAYNTVDLRTGFDYGLWTVQLFAKNLTDDQGVIGFTQQNFSAPSLTSTASVTTPRTIGLAVTGRF